MSLKFPIGLFFTHLLYMPCLMPLALIVQRGARASLGARHGSREGRFETCPYTWKRYKHTTDVAAYTIVVSRVTFLIKH